MYVCILSVLYGFSNMKKKKNLKFRGYILTRDFFQGHRRVSTSSNYKNKIVNFLRRVR